MNDTSMPVPGIQPPSLSVSDVQRGIGEASAVFHAGAEHLNMKGMLHGGIIAGLMDVIMAIAAGSHPEPAQRQFSITLSMSMNFIGSAAAEPLYLKAKTTGGGRRTAFLEARIENAGGDPIATAQGAFKLMQAGSEFREKDPPTA